MHRKVDSHVDTGWHGNVTDIRQLYVSVEFSKCGNTSFRPLLIIDSYCYYALFRDLSHNRITMPHSEVFRELESLKYL